MSGVLIITVSTKDSTHELVFDKATVTIGSDAACDVVLPKAAKHHATIHNVDTHQVMLVEWLLEHRHRCRQKRAPGQIVVGGDEDHREAAPRLAQPFFDLESTDTGKADIDDGAVGRAGLREIRFAGFEQVHFVTEGAQGTPDCAADIHVVIDDDQCQVGLAG